MSLIEQAARRLEQLREAGSQLSGDLEFPAADAAVVVVILLASTVVSAATLAVAIAVLFPA